MSQVKFSYSQSLKTLELISEEIHRKRKKQHEEEIPNGPREPGVGAELNSPVDENPSRKIFEVNSPEQNPNRKIFNRNSPIDSTRKMFDRNSPIDSTRKIFDRNSPMDPTRKMFDIEQNPNRKVFDGSCQIDPNRKMFENSPEHNPNRKMFNSPSDPNRKIFDSSSNIEANPNRTFNNSPIDSPSHMFNAGSAIDENRMFDEMDEDSNRKIYDLEYEIENCGAQSIGSVSATPSSCLSEKDENETADELEMNDLRMKVKQLAVR